MVIDKVINNNIVSCIDDKGKEAVIMGRGLGFKCKPGQPIDESKIEKIYRVDNSQESERFQEAFADIPLECLQVSDDIITYAKTVINNQLSKNIYITLSDHINFAVTRYKQGIHFTNALSWEIKKFYHQEYEVGLKAVELIKDKLGVALSEEEAASIALHFVNAELGMELPNTIDVTKLIQSVLKIITYHFKVVINDQSLNYERFITHLKFFSQRVITNNNNHNDDPELHDMIKHQYPEMYACSEKIRRYIKKEYGFTLPDEEMVYLTIHIKRIISEHR